MITLAALLEHKDQLKIDVQGARRIVSLVTGQNSPKKYDSVIKWLRGCHYEPALHEQVMKAIDEILGTHGVEAIFDDGTTEPWLSYCNAGDPYVTTIVYDHGEDEYRIACWADELEAHETNEDEEAEGDHREEIIEGMIEIFWGHAWVNHVDESRCQSLSGVEITDVMPDAPDCARGLVDQVVAKIEEANSGSSLDRLYRAAMRANEDAGQRSSCKTSGPRRFGNCLAYMSTGAGITWADDNADITLVVPECGYLAEQDLRDHADEHCDECNDEDE